MTVGVLLFGLSAVLVVGQQAEPVAAQTPAQKQAEKMKILQAQLAQANQTIAVLKQEVTQLQNANKQLDTTGKKAGAADDKAMKSLQSTVDGYRNAGLVHVVALKLKSDSSDDEVQSVIDDTYSMLAKIKPVRGVWAGRPSGSGTPDVAKNDYTVALMLVFDNSSGLKTYLDDPVHKKFADKHLKKWETPVVYDFEPKKKPAP
jgi:hypothetical protein